MEKENLMEVPIGFPKLTADKVLLDKIVEMSNNIVITTNNSLVHKYSALAQLGLTELSNRENNRNSKFFRNMTIISSVLSFVAILCSSMCIYYADKDDKADTMWQENQMKYYKTITEELKETNLKIDSIYRIQKSRVVLPKSGKAKRN